MLRVLQCVNNMHRAGLETMLMNYYRSIDRTKVQFDFLTHRKERSDYDDEIEALGGRIYRAPRLYPQNYPAYFRYMKDFFREHPEYKIVHSHIDAMSYLPLLAAQKANVPVRIAHSHNTGIDRDFKYPLKQYFRCRLGGVATHCLACGSEAGAFLFRDRDFLVIPNAVDASKFRYNKMVRQQKREELGISERFAVGHIGRMSYQKNHEFLLQVFAKLLEKRPDSILLLVGSGEKEQELKNKAADLGIASDVRFLGSRSDVHELYQAMDVFVMPSHFEGIPLVGIEAQFAGLPCLFSDGVPQEVCFGKHCQFRSLSDPMSQWVEDICSLMTEAERGSHIECSPYDIKTAAVHLQRLYEDLAKE